MNRKKPQLPNDIILKIMRMKIEDDKKDFYKYRFSFFVIKELNYNIHRMRFKYNEFKDLNKDDFLNNAYTCKWCLTSIANNKIELID